jgi:tetratricopeptide (TPR) repeat protein
MRPIGEDAFALVLHPGVAESGRAAAGDAFRTAADAELAAFWRAMMAHGLEHEGQTPGAGAMIRRAGLAAAPYLLRRQDWETARGMLEQVIHRDKAPATVAAVLPLLRRIADATAGTKKELESLGLLARVLSIAGRVEEAEGTLRDVIARAEQAGAFRTAGTVSGDLLNLLRNTGRPQAALDVAEQKAEFTRRAGLGPWTQLLDEGQRLQILNVLGRHAEVLRAVDEALRPRMAALPDPPGPEDSGISTWNVREVTLDTGHAAALALEQWQEALNLHAEIEESKRKRGAPPLEQARTRFNNYGPLLRLRRFAEARALLHDCRTVFERENAMQELGKVFSALADLEDKTIGPAAARRFEEAALRYRYAAADLEGIAISHFNLANYLGKAQGPPGEVLAHRLAAVLLVAVMGSGSLQEDLQALARDIAAVGPQVHAHLPADFAALCATLAAGEGVRFREVFDRLAAGRATGDALLQDVLAQAFSLVRESSAGPSDAAIRERLAEHAPLIQAVATAARQPSVRPQLNEALAQMRQHGWGNLVDAVGRLLDGERDENALCAGLDGEDSLIVTTVLRALADPAVLAELQSPRSDGETED